MALCLPAVTVVAILLERRCHILPDIVAVPFVLALLFLVPACVGCGIALGIITWRRAETTTGKMAGVLIALAELGVGVALGIGLAGVKFITPQT